MRVVIATRASALARWQADFVADALRAAAEASGTAVDVDFDVIETTADRRLDIPIWEMGGKGVFVKEVQARVLDGRAHLAVHSAKDLPALTPPGLAIAAVPERADPRDVLVGHAPLAGLAPGALVATGSVRRRAQLVHARPDLTFDGLRGNIATRLTKVPPGGAIVMAAAALDRLGLAGELDERGLVAEVLTPAVMLPQVGQGSLAVESTSDPEPELAELLRAIDHMPSRLRLGFEREFLVELGGDCDLPAGAFATLRPGSGGVVVEVEGMLASADGTTVLRHAAEAPLPDAIGLGAAVARHLRDAGGDGLLPS